MKKGNRVVYGIFDTRMEVENAVSSMKAAGFRNSDISVLLPQLGDTQSFAHEKSTKAPEGGTLGGITGALVGFGIPEFEAKRYEGFVKNGGILFSVHVDDLKWADKAKDILETTGAHDIASTIEEANRVTPDIEHTQYF